MSPGVRYLDSSAIVKLVVPEPQSNALMRALSDGEAVVTSALSPVEVLRAVRCAGLAADFGERAQEVFERMTLVRLEDSILRQAAGLEPSGLRSLDAIHLATALTFAGELTAFFTYDLRLGQAAEVSGLVVQAPS